jgi:hypothetical protein
LNSFGVFLMLLFLLVEQPLEAFNLLAGLALFLFT